MQSQFFFVLFLGVNNYQEKICSFFLSSSDILLEVCNILVKSYNRLSDVKTQNGLLLYKST